MLAGMDSESDPRDPPPRRFADIVTLAPELRIPAWVAVGVLAAGAVGIAQAQLMAAGSTAERVARSVFIGGAYAYLAIATIDFTEHFRLEKRLTGRYWSFEAVPLGETINHALTVAVIGAMIALARPIPPAPEWRDWFALGAPLLYMALGWRDELVYHRRRCAHREDLMHTTAHIASAVMLAGFVASRFAFG